MPATILVGAQWGDEGKGKITDFLAEKAEVVVRYQGGNNAGHTVIYGDQVYKLHLVPSGILYSDSLCLIGNSVVVDLAVLLDEMEDLKGRGLSFDRFYISERAHLIMPYHKCLDALEEDAKAEGKIGTTKRGIGPAYVDKISRIGIRLADILDEAEFRRKLRNALAQKNPLIEKVYGGEPFAEEPIVEEFMALAKKARPYIADTALMLDERLRAGKKVLLEGAQGTHLDVDHGTYPFVTSSNPVSGGALVGAGFGPKHVKQVLGVSKAYATRVGSGPFPTELEDEMGEHLRQQGGEFGVTTGRPRRCGWLDLVVLRYSARVNGLTDLALTKLDVLDDLDEIKICTGYEYQGDVLTELPAGLHVLNACKPVYEAFPGWKTATGAAKEFCDLPENAQNYVKKIEELAGVKVSIIAVGPERSQTITRDFCI